MKLINILIMNHCHIVIQYLPQNDYDFCDHSFLNTIIQFHEIFLQISTYAYYYT